MKTDFTQQDKQKMLNDVLELADINQFLQEANGEQTVMIISDDGQLIQAPGACSPEQIYIAEKRRLEILEEQAKDEKTMLDNTLFTTSSKTVEK